MRTPTASTAANLRALDRAIRGVAVQVAALPAEAAAGMIARLKTSPNPMDRAIAAEAERIRSETSKARMA